MCRSHEEENRLRVLLHDTTARSELLESEARQHRADELELRRSSLQVHATDTWRAACNGHVACDMQLVPFRRNGACGMTFYGIAGHLRLRPGV